MKAQLHENCAQNKRQIRKQKRRMAKHQNSSFATFAKMRIAIMEIRQSLERDEMFCRTVETQVAGTWAQRTRLTPPQDRRMS